MAADRKAAFDSINATGAALTGPLIVGFLGAFSVFTFIASLIIMYGIKDSCGDSTLIRVVETQTWISAFLVGWITSFVVDGKVSSLTPDSATIKVWFALTIAVISAVFIMSCWILSEIQSKEPGTGCNPEKETVNSDGTKKTKKTIEPWAAAMVGITTPLIALMIAYCVLAFVVKQIDGTSVS
jgi:uncharacterized membrane protein YhdT